MFLCLFILGISNKSPQLLVGTIVDYEWDDHPNAIEEHKHKPEILELQVRVELWRPILERV